MATSVSLCRPSMSNVMSQHPVEKVWRSFPRHCCVCLLMTGALTGQYSCLFLVGGVAQWLERRSWPANFPCLALDLQLVGDH